MMPSVASIAAAWSYHDRQDSLGTGKQVSICNSQMAKAYHVSQNCRGLNRCTHAVVKITKKEAVEQYGRVECQVCY
jgi:hypothetical protein